MKRAYRSFGSRGFFLLALSFCIWLGACSSRPTSVTSKASAIGDQPQPSANAPERMPKFDLKDPVGHEFTSAQLRGKVILLDFWGTWCAPCKQEIPGYESLYRRYKDRGFVVIGIAADSDPALVAEFAKKLKISYPMLINGMELQKYGVDGLPETMLIDRSGVIRKKVVGFEYTEAFENALRKLL